MYCCVGWACNKESNSRLNTLHRGELRGWQLHQLLSGQQYPKLWARRIVERTTAKEKRPIEMIGRIILKCILLHVQKIVHWLALVNTAINLGVPWSAELLIRWATVIVWIIFLLHEVSHVQWNLSVREPQCIGSFSAAGRSHSIQVFEVKNLSYCESYQLVTGFRSIQVPVKTGFTVFFLP
jgi:hypothetical protein